MTAGTIAVQAPARQMRRCRQSCTDHSSIFHCLPPFPTAVYLGMQKRRDFFEWPLIVAMGFENPFCVMTRSKATGRQAETYADS